MNAGLTVKKMGLTSYSTCAIMSDDQLYCWGLASSLLHISMRAAV
jgi:hypothetical protein